MIHIAVVEDESDYREQMKRFFRHYQDEYKIAIKLSFFSDGIQIVNRYAGNYDIILLDIQMDVMDGMETAEKIRERDQEVVIIFVTNTANYAVLGYSVDAKDYLVKPVDYVSFSKKIDRIIDKIEARKTYCISIPVTDGVQKLSVEDIYVIESQGHELLYYTSLQIYRSRGVMKKVEDTLKKYGFFRVHKGYLVNLRHVEGMYDSYCTINKNQIPVGRTKRKEFMQTLVNYMSESLI